MSMTGLELSILIPAFLAGLLVLASHVPLGMQVLARGIVFIDLAIAQIAGLGVIGADLMGFEPQGFEVLLVGKDGGVKLRQGRQVAAETLFAKIDGVVAYERQGRSRQKVSVYAAA